MEATRKKWTALDWAIGIFFLVCIGLFLWAMYLRDVSLQEYWAKTERNQEQLVKVTAKDYPWIKITDVSGIGVDTFYSDAFVTVKIGPNCTYSMQAEPNTKGVWHLLPYSQESTLTETQVANGAPPYGDADCPKDPLKKAAS